MPIKSPRIGAKKKTEMAKAKIEIKRKIKRHRKKNPDGSDRPSPKMYFNSDTQSAIVAYQKSEDKKEREALFVKEILPAFEKLVENLINIHRFTGLHDTYEDLKSDCVNFLFETIYKFDATRGTNAFSYFNVVAKNWLIIRSKQRNLNSKRNISVDDKDEFTPHELKIIEDNSTLPSQDVILDKEHSAQNVMKMLFEIKERAKTESEIVCINSIITIFENVNEIDLLNKTAVLLYVRELSGFNSKQLTSVLQILKKNYRKIRQENSSR